MVRLLYFGLGAFAIWLALETPLDSLADNYLQSVHMLQHVLLGVVAGPLLVLGLSPCMAAWLLDRAPGLRRLTKPILAQVIAGAVMIAWHLPVLYNLTLAVDAVHIFEHLTFIGAGVLFWWPLVSATAEQAVWRLGDGLKLLYILVGTLPQDGVALVLQFSRDLFYPHYGQVTELVPGWTPVIDQQVSGAVLMLVGKTSFLVAAIAIFFRWIATGEEDGGRTEVPPPDPTSFWRT